MNLDSHLFICDRGFKCHYYEYEKWNTIKVTEVKHMQINGAIGKVYNVCDWIMKLAYVNLLWLLFSLIGFILLGVTPAFVALFTIVRKWFMKETDIPIFQTFAQTYKREFIKANKLGFLMALIGSFLFFDFTFLNSIGGSVQYTLSVPLFIITFFYFITLLYLFPVYVQYELKPIQYIKNSFYIGILNMHITMLMIAAILLITIVFTYIPGIVPFFSVILFGLAFMWGGTISFRRIEMRQRDINVQNQG